MRKSVQIVRKSVESLFRNGEMVGESGASYMAISFCDVSYMKKSVCWISVID